MKRRVISLFLALIFAFTLGAAAWADAEPAPEASAEPAPEASAEPEPEASEEPAPEASTEPKPEASTEPEPETSEEPAPEASTEPKPEASAEPAPEVSAEPEPEASTEPVPEASAEPEPETSAEPEPEADEAIAPAAEEPVTGSCGYNAIYEISDGTLTIRVEDPSDGYAAIYSSNDWSDYAGEITKAVVEDGFDSLPMYLFRGLTNLASVDIAASVESISPYVFEGCAPSLTITIRNPFCSTSAYTEEEESHIFPAGATVIAYEHSHMYDLAEEYGCSAQSLGKFAGSGSWDNWDEDCSGTWTLTGDGVLTISGSGTVDASSWSYAGYDPFFPNYLSRFVSTIIIEEGVDAIESYAFGHFLRLTRVVIPSSVKTIGGHVFDYCSSLTEVQNTDGTPWTGAGVSGATTAFTGTPWLDSHVDSNGFIIFNGMLVNYIGSATDIVIPGSVTCIGTCAFNDMAPWDFNRDSIESVVIPSSVQRIEDNAFWGCVKLTHVELPEGLTYMGAGAFAMCTALTEVKLPQSLTTLKGSAFDGCESLATVNIPAGVATIGGHAFAGTALTNVTLPEGVSYIEYSAFADCTSLASVSLPQSLKTIEESVFDGTALTSVTIPESVTSVGVMWDGIKPGEGYRGYGAFNGCSALTSVTILNKDCDMSLANEDASDRDDLYTHATIRGHAGSTASAYAKEYGYTFVSIDLPASSDTTGDGKTDLADVVILFERLCDLSAGGTAAVPDLCEDGKSDLKDITALYQLVSPAQG